MSVESINANSVPSVQPSVSATPSTEKQDKTERLVETAKVESIVKAVDAEQVDRAELDVAVDKLNEFMSSTPQQNLSFSVDEDTKEMVVTVRDSETLEVIKQMPTKEALAVAKQIESMLGLILNDTA